MAEKVRKKCESPPFSHTKCGTFPFVQRMGYIHPKKKKKKKEKKTSIKNTQKKSHHCFEMYPRMADTIFQKEEKKKIPVFKFICSSSLKKKFSFDFVFFAEVTYNFHKGNEIILALFEGCVK